MKFLRKLSRTEAVTAVAAYVGASATEPDSRWYRRQSKPDWQPPAALFPIVWTALYGTIAASSAHVIVALDDREADADDLGMREDAIEERKSFKKALGVNLALNAGWSVLFWQARSPRAAAYEAAVLALSSADLARRARRVSVGAGAALVPYVAWTAFATVLTVDIARRN